MDLELIAYLNSFNTEIFLWIWNELFIWIPLTLKSFVDLELIAYMNSFNTEIFCGSGMNCLFEFH